MENLFIKATKNKMRFNYKGLISVEDLWDLSLEALDKIFFNLNSEATKINTPSLLVKRTNEGKDLADKLKVVKYVFDEKINKKNQLLLEKQKSDRKQKLLSILADKQDSELKGKSTEEIQAMINEL